MYMALVFMRLVFTSLLVVLGCYLINPTASFWLVMGLCGIGNVLVVLDEARR